jgi:hypothetical protein
LGTLGTELGIVHSFYDSMHYGSKLVITFIRNLHAGHAKYWFPWPGVLPFTT